MLDGLISCKFPAIDLLKIMTIGLHSTYVEVMGNFLRHRNKEKMEDLVKLSSKVNFLLCIFVRFLDITFATCCLPAFSFYNFEVNSDFL